MYQVTIFDVLREQFDKELKKIESLYFALHEKWVSLIRSSRSHSQSEGNEIKN